ncbi:MAG: dUTP diphosphatase [Rhodospirillales bacterium]
MRADSPSRLKIAIQRLPHAHDLDLPRYATPGSAGLDLLAAVALDLAPGARHLVPCGIALALPAGWEGQIRPRSGLAFRHGVSVLNAPGTIDSDYRGELAVLLINLGQDPYAILRGARIAQLVVAPVTSVVWQEVACLDETARGAQGFGSTG